MSTLACSTHPHHNCMSHLRRNIARIRRYKLHAGSVHSLLHSSADHRFKQGYGTLPVTRYPPHIYILHCIAIHLPNLIVSSPYSPEPTLQLHTVFIEKPPRYLYCTNIRIGTPCDTPTPQHTQIQFQAQRRSPALHHLQNLFHTLQLPPIVLLSHQHNESQHPQHNYYTFYFRHWYYLRETSQDAPSPVYYTSILIMNAFTRILDNLFTTTPEKPSELHPVRTSESHPLEIGMIGREVMRRIGFGKDNFGEDEDDKDFKKDTIPSSPSDNPDNFQLTIEGKTEEKTDDDHNSISTLTPSTPVSASILSKIPTIGMHMCPGRNKKIWQRDLQKDLDYLKMHNVKCIVTLVRGIELESMQLGSVTYFEQLQKNGFESYHYPVRDKWLPSNAVELCLAVEWIWKKLREGKNVTVHCNGGKGRAATIVACFLVASAEGKVSGSEAIRIVQEARPGSLRNPLQQLYVRRFRSMWEKFLRMQENGELLPALDFIDEENAQVDLNTDIEKAIAEEEKKSPRFREQLKQFEAEGIEKLQQESGKFVKHVVKGVEESPTEEDSLQQHEEKLLDFSTPTPQKSKRDSSIFEREKEST